MQILKESDKISIYGLLNIKDHKKGTDTNIDISAENKKVKTVGEYLYNVLFKQYGRFNYDWDSITKIVKTRQVIVNNQEVSKNSKFKFYGYIEDWRGIPWDDGKKYNFCTEELLFDELIETMESIFEDYIVDFDTDETGLKFIITKIEIIEK